MTTYYFSTITPAQALAYDGFSDLLMGTGMGNPPLTVTFDESEPGKPAGRIEFRYTRVK